MKAIVLVLALLTAGCAASTQRVLVVVDQSLYETLNDVFQLEQTALCGKPDCYQPGLEGGGTMLATPVQGWTVEKSKAFNRVLLPAVEAGRQFNQVLMNWQPGAPVPLQVRSLIRDVSAALVAIASDFPTSVAKSQLLERIGRVQSIILQAFDVILSLQPVKEVRVKPPLKPYNNGLMR